MSDTMNTSSVVKIAGLIGSRNYITFAEIEGITGLAMPDAVRLKPLLEEFMRQQEGGATITISSRTDLMPPGFSIDD